MAVVKNLMVRAGADFSAITKQAKKASQSMRGMQSSVSRSCDMMAKAAGGVKKMLGAIGVGLGVAAIVNFGKEAAAAYDAQVAGEMRLATVMRNTMGASNAEIQSILDLTAAQQKLGIVGDEVQLSGAQELATYLNLTSSLKTLIPVMNDMAVQQYGYNVTAEETASIATMLGKVMEGQTSALSRYGYYFDAAQEQILKYGTEEQRAATLAEVVQQSVGGMNAALAATPTGRMKQLSNALGDIKEQFGQAVRTIGTAFLPLLNAVGSILAGIATMASKVAQAIANVFGGSVAGKEWQWAGISSGVSDTADAMNDLTSAQEGSAAAAKKQREALQTASFDTLNILRATDAAGSSGSGSGGSAYGGGSAAESVIHETQTAAEEGSGALEWLQQKLAKLKALWEDFRARLDFTRLKLAWGELKDAISRFGSSVGSVLGAVWEKYLKPLAVWTINKALPATLEALAKVIDYVAEKIENLASLIRGDMTFKEWLQTLSPLEVILGAVALAFVAVTTGVKLFIAALSGIKAITSIVSAAITALSSPIGVAIIAIAALVAIGVLLYKNWDKICAAAGRLKETVVSSITSLVEKVTSPFKKLIDSIKKFYTEMSNMISKIRSLFNFQWQLPKFKVPHLTWGTKPVGGWIGQILNMLGLPMYLPDLHVSWYAKGGVFDKASLIGVGENGKEAVVPLERNTGWISRVASELAAQMAGVAGLFGGDDQADVLRRAVMDGMMAAMSGQSRSGTVQVNINGREFYRATYRDLQAVSRERGIALIKT